LEAVRLAGEDRELLADDETDAGAILLGAGHLEAAEAHLRHAVGINQELYGPDYPQNIAALVNLGWALRERHQFDEARKTLARVLAIEEHAFGMDSPRLVNTLDHLTETAAGLRDGTAARGFCERALAIATAQQKELLVAEAASHCGHALLALGDARAARAPIERALPIAEKIYGAQHPYVAGTLTDLGGVQLALGELPAAGASYERALAILEKGVGPEHPDVANVLVGLARVRLAERDARAALPLLLRATMIRDKVHAPATDRAEAAFLRARALWLSGLRARAVDAAKQAEELYPAGDAGRSEIAAWLASPR
jgi:tetratricopeptide (TPR) repeat protein